MRRCNGLATQLLFQTCCRCAQELRTVYSTPQNIQFLGSRAATIVGAAFSTAAPGGTLHGSTANTPVAAGSVNAVNGSSSSIGGSSSTNALSATDAGSLQAQIGQQQGLLTTLISGCSSRDVGPQHIGLYYDFNKALAPEAFRPFHQAFYSPRPAKLQRKGGCRALQEEFSSTNSSCLMWRRSSQELAHTLQSTAGVKVHLRGPAGAGKSIAVVQLVEWARSNGWLVLYVPSAAALTRGGFFYKRPDGTYDTIISAQHILKSVADAHQQQLTGLPVRLQHSKQLLGSPAAAVASKTASAGADGAGSLLDLVNTGLSTDSNGQLAVDCCLQLVHELAALSTQQPVLLAVDDYNALYWKTDYGVTKLVTPEGRPPYQYRKELKVTRFNLASSFRLLERRDLQHCRVLVADNCSSGVPADLRVPNKAASLYDMPRFSPVETAHALFYYHECGLVPATPSLQQVTALRALTDGSGAELRRWSVKITQTDMGLL